MSDVSTYTNETTLNNNADPSITQRVFEIIKASGVAGKTCAEVESELNLDKKLSGRVRELVLAGRIKDSGVRRPTRYGKQGRVYVVSPDRGNK